MLQDGTVVMINRTSFGPIVDHGEEKAGGKGGEKGQDSTSPKYLPPDDASVQQFLAGLQGKLDALEQAVKETQLQLAQLQISKPNNR